MFCHILSMKLLLHGSEQQQQKALVTKGGPEADSSQM